MKNHIYYVPGKLSTFIHYGSSKISMKGLITDIAKVLVDYPEEVRVSEVVGEKTTVLELRVTKTDLGKVTGKQ